MKKEKPNEEKRCKRCGEKISKWSTSGLCVICENLHPPQYFRK